MPAMMVFISARVFEQASGKCHSLQNMHSLVHLYRPVKPEAVLLVFGLKFGFCDGAGRDLAPVANCDAVVFSVFWIAG